MPSVLLKMCFWPSLTLLKGGERPSLVGPPLVSRQSSPFGLWEIEPPVAVLASTTAPASAPAAAPASPRAAAPTAAAAATAAASAVAAAAERRFFLPVLLFPFRCFFFFLPSPVPLSTQAAALPLLASPSPLPPSPAPTSTPPKPLLPEPPPLTPTPPPPLPVVPGVGPHKQTTFCNIVL